MAAVPRIDRSHLTTRARIHADARDRRQAATAEELKAELAPQLSEITARVHELWAEFRLEQAELVAAESRGGDVAFRRDGPKIGRNQPCPCGSEKKYKRCCGATN